ncbi:TniQ family protein [Nonomuraea sp. NPDC046802]|uniref:TniQ family protein n=1 Tax=Nonomuraea sp. NPDC046802 TaxID=3154919 RepID=UPI0033FB8E1C
MTSLPITPQETTSRACRQCGNVLSLVARKDAEYCSNACRARGGRARRRQQQIDERSATSRQCPACLRDITGQGQSRSDLVYCSAACRTRAWRTRTTGSARHKPRLRGLPIRPRPIPNETLTSYIQRLAKANHFSPRFLLSQLRGTPLPGGTTVSIVLLAAAVDMSEHALRRALPEFRRSSGDVVLGKHGKAVGFHLETIRPACRHCAAARDVFEPVDCWMAPQHNVCLTHQLWIGPNTTNPADQLDVSQFPEIGRAQRRQLKLGRYPMNVNAYHEAREICRRWAASNIFTHLRDQRLEALTPNGEPSPSAGQAAAYPELIAMNGLLANPIWRALAANGDPASLQRLYHEVGLRIGQTYKPLTAWDPLLRWALEQQPLTRHASEQQYEAR